MSPDQYEWSLLYSSLHRNPQAIINLGIDTQDDLYAFSLSEATRLDRHRDVSRGLSSATIPGGRDENSKEAEQKRFDTLNAIRERIKSCSIAFQDRVVSICHLAGSHPDLDVRFLAIRVAFNGYYSLRRSKTAGSVAGAGSGTGGSKSTR